MKLKVPFYSNTPDDTHCFQAVIRMVLKYFLPEKEFSWKQLERMTAKKKDKWTWPMQGLINLKKMGFDIVKTFDFDYLRFFQEGEEYLMERYGEEKGKAQIENSDVDQERRLSKEYLKVFDQEERTPSISDIKKFLRKGYLVSCNLNYYALYNKKGYAGHSVLVIGFDKGNFYLHDPGCPPKKNLKVSLKRFIKAWAYPTTREQNLTAYRYRP